jgi:hypothetical protein
MPPVLPVSAEGDRRFFIAFAGGEHMATELLAFGPPVCIALALAALYFITRKT